jgi:cytoskeleton protein RodZ
MSEEGSASSAEPTAGALLRRAREQAGLHLDVLAGALKVPPRQLEALETDRIDLLPDVVFARALAASVCRNLKVSPRVVLDKLPRSADSRLGRDEPINVPFRVPGESFGGPLRAQLMRPPVIAAIALVVAALIVWWLPSFSPLMTQRDAAIETPSGSPGTDAPSAPVTEPARQVTESVTPSLANQLALSPAQASQAPAVQGNAAAAGGVTVEFHATQASWVHVADAKGNVPLRRTLNAGESISVSGAPPLAVTVGSARAVQVKVHGRPFDLAPVAHDNVARFEVR